MFSIYWSPEFCSEQAQMLPPAAGLLWPHRGRESWPVLTAQCLGVGREQEKYQLPSQTLGLALLFLPTYLSHPHTFSAPIIGWVCLLVPKKFCFCPWTQVPNDALREWSTKTDQLLWVGGWGGPLISSRLLKKRTVSQQILLPEIVHPVFLEPRERSWTTYYSKMTKIRAQHEVVGLLGYLTWG